MRRFFSACIVVVLAIPIAAPFIYVSTVSGQLQGATTQPFGGVLTIYTPCTCNTYLSAYRVISLPTPATTILNMTGPQTGTDIRREYVTYRPGAWQLGVMDTVTGANTCYQIAYPSCYYYTAQGQEEIVGDSF